MRRCAGSCSAKKFEKCSGGWTDCYHVGAYHVHHFRPGGIAPTRFRATKLDRYAPWDLIEREPTFVTLELALAYAFGDQP